MNVNTLSTESYKTLIPSTVITHVGFGRAAPHPKTQLTEEITKTVFASASFGMSEVCTCMAR